ncbi:hypothetical protein C2845_PM17G08760 [Panicum miliaceum]|uniref:Uncharacterized protein n=1 Tax=Panicum miliaceum TaxID=4540 RepID=A0A3L6Q526_PANMI|nr:hypothetical protein C2845_PM17G08760 [Panicum miliaceum]
MAQKTLRQYSTPSRSHIPTGLDNTQGTDGFELKAGLVNMVQASPFCGKATEDANTHLQNFIEALEKQRDVESTEGRRHGAAAFLR